MPFQVAVIDEVGCGELDEEHATGLCAATFRNRGFDPESLGEVSVVLVDSGVMRDLNEKFRGKDTPTDVLSFQVDGPDGEMVGEIVISPEAMNPHMGIEELVVHGALHLCGMDHGEDFESSEMAGVQAQVLETVRG